MGIHEDLSQIAVTTNSEAVAKGTALAWIAVVAADGKIGQRELVLLNNFAKSNLGTKAFYSELWLAGIFEEALKIIKEGGLNTLYAALPAYFTQTQEGDKQTLLYSLMLLSIFEDDFSSQEMEAVNQIVEILDIPRKNVLYLGMMFAGRSKDSFLK